MTGWVWTAAALVAAVPSGVAAQDLAERVLRAGAGTVRFTFDTRPGVEICDQGVRFGDRTMWWHTDRGRHRESDCRFGPAEVELDVANGRVRRVELVKRRARGDQAVTDLGTIPPREAARYLLSLTRVPDVTRGAAQDAILPAMLADAEGLWRDLLAIAKDRDVRRKVRKSAMFWVGQEAADAVTDGLTAVAWDEDEDQAVRDWAVFALSQRPARESVPVLMELARTADQAKTRRSAMFWLAQSDHASVVGFFEDVLLGRGGD